MPVPSLTSLRARRAAALVAAVLAALGGGASARAEPPPTPQAASWLVYAPGHGGLLASHDVDAERAVASLTKLMTARLVLQSGRLDETTTVGPDATSVGESEVPLATGERQTVRDLLAALLIRSANDAAAALADAVAGSQTSFVERMNAEVQRLGLRHTHYATPYGLDDPANYSSARDVLTLSRLDMQNALFRSFAGAPRGTIPGHSFATRNTLLAAYPGLDGVKTGNTDDAGWCLSASATRGTIRLFVVVLGSPSEAQRDLDVTRLLNWGFDRFHEAPLVRQGQRFGTLREPYTGHEVAAVAATGVTRVVRPEERFEQRVELPTRSPARRAGQRVGMLTLLQRGRVVAQVPLIAAGALNGPGEIDRLRWLTSHTWQGLVGGASVLALVVIRPVRTRRGRV
jgi:serine-type D-Ala-D-Ala carboxypeptidase (penicillin-binding protein 5/6)